MYTYTQEDREILPSRESLTYYLKNRPFAHLFDIMREFFELEPFLLEDSEHFNAFSLFLEEYLADLIKSSVLARRGKYYFLYKNKNQVLQVDIPTEEQIISTLNKLNTPINAIELSILYFDGCDLVKLQNLCNKLVDRGILAKIDHDNFYLIQD